MLKWIQSYQGQPEGTSGCSGVQESSHFSAAQVSGLSEDSLAPGNNPWSLRRVDPLDPNPWILERVE